MAHEVPNITLNNGVEMPPSGSASSRPRPTRRAAAVEAALEHRLPPHRHRRRLRQRARGRRSRRTLRRRPRDEVFLETKIWISDYGYDETLHGFEKSAGKLGVDQIDLLILHQALPSDFDKTLEAYRALETLLEDGKVRAIGVSNFMVDHLTALLETGRRSCRRSTRSRCTPTSSSARSRRSAPSTAS